MVRFSPQIKRNPDRSRRMLKNDQPIEQMNKVVVVDRCTGMIPVTRTDFTSQEDRDAPMSTLTH